MAEKETESEEEGEMNLGCCILWGEIDENRFSFKCRFGSLSPTQEVAYVYFNDLYESRPSLPGDNKTSGKRS